MDGENDVSRIRRDNDILITEDGFEPNELMLETGNEVNFINSTNQLHHIASEADVFDSGDIDPGEMFSFVFDVPGTHNFYCRYHDNEKGRVVVE